MSKNKETLPKEFNADKKIELPLSLNNVGYSLMEKNGLWQVVKFHFDAESLTMGTLEVVSENSNQFDAGDELVLLLDEEIFNR